MTEGSVTILPQAHPIEAPHVEQMSFEEEVLRANLEATKQSTKKEK